MTQLNRLNLLSNPYLATESRLRVTQLANSIQKEKATIFTDFIKDNQTDCSCEWRNASSEDLTEYCKS